MCIWALSGKDEAMRRSTMSRRPFPDEYPLRAVCVRLQDRRQPHSWATLWQWQKTGYLVPAKMGRRSLYALSDIQKILATRKRHDDDDDEDWQLRYLGLWSILFKNSTDWITPWYVCYRIPEYPTTQISKYHNTWLCKYANTWIPQLYNLWLLSYYNRLFR